MLDIQAIENFHFLRPIWLLGFILVLLVHLRFRSIHSALAGWKKAVAPHLLPHMKVSSGPLNKLRPYQLMTIALSLVVVITAGPSWKKQITPFTEDRAPLVIALELTRSMMAADQPPTRLERAKQKIRDLLAVRAGARTAVVTYAGSAHAALPLTDDIELIEIYLESLLPSLMPIEGDNPAVALDLIRDMLENETVAGTILFMSDGIDRSYEASFAAFTAGSNHQLLFMGFGSDQGGLAKDEFDRMTDFRVSGTDWAGLRTAADASGGKLLRSTLDSDDIETLSRLLRSHLVDALDEDKNLRWMDGGYYLVWVLMLLSLFWFRKGWTIL